MTRSRQRRRIPSSEPATTVGQVFEGYDGTPANPPQVLVVETGNEDLADEDDGDRAELADEDADLRQALARAAVWIAEQEYGPAQAALTRYVAAVAVKDWDTTVILRELLANRLLTASTVADVLMPFNAGELDAYLDVTLAIDAVTFVETLRPDYPWYAMVNATVAGQRGSVALTVGGERVVTRLAAASRVGLLPLRGQLVLVESEVTGQPPILDLLSAPDEA